MSDSTTEDFRALNIVASYVKEYGFNSNWAEDIDCALHDDGIETGDSSDLDAFAGEVVRLKSGVVISWDAKNEWAVIR